jgi:hypothetical protein
MPTYEIHDNGSVPFRVEVRGKTVTVLQNMDTYKMINGKFTVIEHPNKTFTVNVDEVFVGKTSPTGPKSPPGTTVLFRVGSKYTYVGSEMYEFTTNDVILKYYSDLGNSDVPYPYAIGEKYIYIMLDKVAVEKSLFDMKQDIYKQYYEKYDKKTKLKAIKLKTKKVQTGKVQTGKTMKTMKTGKTKKDTTRKIPKKYLTRDSPPYPANDYCGKKKPGNDGLMYISKPDKNGICKWIKV